MWLMTEKHRHKIKCQLLPNSSSKCKQEKGTETDKKNTQWTVSLSLDSSSLELGQKFGLDTRTRQKKTTPPKSGSVNHSPAPKELCSPESPTDGPNCSRALGSWLEDGNQYRSGSPGGVFLSVSRLWLPYTRRQVVHPQTSVTDSPNDCKLYPELKVQEWKPMKIREIFRTTGSLKSVFMI